MKPTTPESGPATVGAGSVKRKCAPPFGRFEPEMMPPGAAMIDWQFVIADEQEGLFDDLIEVDETFLGQVVSSCSGGTGYVTANRTSTIVPSKTRIWFR
jgi:hypothetical protein